MIPPERLGRTVFSNALGRFGCTCSVGVNASQWEVMVFEADVTTNQQLLFDVRQRTHGVVGTKWTLEITEFPNDEPGVGGPERMRCLLKNVCTDLLYGQLEIHLEWGLTADLQTPQIGTDPENHLTLATQRSRSGLQKRLHST